jgi:hypothetical protein
MPTRRRPSPTHLLWPLLLSLLATPTNLKAYVDPGSGSFLIQMLIAGMLGAAMTLKTLWRQLKAYLHRTRASQK